MLSLNFCGCLINRKLKNCSVFLLCIGNLWGSTNFLCYVDNFAKVTILFLNVLRIILIARMYNILKINLPGFVYKQLPTIETFPNKHTI